MTSAPTTSSVRNPGESTPMTPDQTTWFAETFDALVADQVQPLL